MPEPLLDKDNGRSFSSAVPRPKRDFSEFLYPSPPKAVRVQKFCIMCNTPFKPRIGLERLKGRKHIPRPGVGVVLCSMTCATRFEKEIGGNPLLYGVGASTQRTCKRCRTPLVDKRVMCRPCRVSTSVSKQLVKAGKKKERFQKTLAVQRVMQERGGREEVWD